MVSVVIAVFGEVHFGKTEPIWRGSESIIVQICRNILSSSHFTMKKIT
jgi:hypothetical protein